MPAIAPTPLPAPWRLRWKAATWLGGATTLYGLVVLWLAAGRLGRDPAVDWMVVASVLLRDGALQVQPSPAVVITGMAVNQALEFAWTLLFFLGFGRWTATATPARIALAWLPWAALTATVEWTLLMPLWPFAQPLFSLSHPLWLGWMVHAVSMSLYPLYPWLLQRLSARPRRADRFSRRWAIGAGATLVAAGVLAALPLEPPYLGTRLQADQRWLRHIAVHHQQGQQLAALAEQRAQSERLRALARLMQATQAADLRAIERWWVSWTGAPPAWVCSAAERAAMPGLLSEQQLQALAATPAEGFDAAFVDAMSWHHAGAAQMAGALLDEPTDPRLWLQAHAMRHAQRGEIALMHDLRGTRAVRAAWAAMGR